jgi:hypothetical protein
MVYDTKNSRVSGLCLLSEFYKRENAIFRKLDLYSSSGEGKETPILLGPLERTNLNH